MEHTAIPWELSKKEPFDVIYDICVYHNDECAHIALWVHEANARFIVKAVNNHERLVENIQRLIHSYEFHCPEAKEESNAIKLAKQALAELEE